MSPGKYAFNLAKEILLQAYKIPLTLPVKLSFPLK